MRHPRAFCEGGSLVEFGFPDSTAAGGLPGSWVEGAGPGGAGSGSVGAEERHMCFSRIKGNIQLLVEDADTADQARTTLRPGGRGMELGAQRLPAKMSPVGFSFSMLLVLPPQAA